MDFFADQNKGLFAVASRVPFQAFHMDIVIGDDHHVQPGLDGSLGNFRVGGEAVGIDGMDMQVDGDLRHRVFAVDDSLGRKV